MHKINRLQKSHYKAFTLVELLLVVVIIGILAGMLGTRLAGRTQQARIARARADLAGQLLLALDIFEQDTGRYPTASEGLAALMEDPGLEGWNGPYLKTGLKPDPWGTPYAYQPDPDKPGQFSVKSAGPDRQLGTPDDISP